MAGAQRPTAIDPDRWHIRILACGREPLWPWWRLRGCANPALVVYANDRDGAGIIAGGRRLPLRGGHVVLIPPDTPFDTWTGADVHQVYFHVDVLGLPASALRALMPAPLDLGRDEILRAQSARLHDVIGRTGPDGRGDASPLAALAALAFIHQALARAVEISPARRRLAWGERLRAQGLLAPALHAIETGLTGPLYVTDLAARCGLGAAWFTTRFRAATGLTPTQYILERRTALACQRLAFTDEPIDTIAVACGFVDRAHLGRVFTSRRGLAPAAYRARERRRPA